MTPEQTIRAELTRAYAKHGDLPWGRHEFYAILLEEVEECWDEIKADSPVEDVLREAVQIAAVVMRYMETGDRYLGKHPELTEPEHKVVFRFTMPPYEIAPPQYYGPVKQSCSCGEDLCDEAVNA